MNRKYILYLINALLVILSILAIIKSIFVSFDIDESYAVTQAYRLLTGDRILADRWEPHQLSAYGAAIFMLPYLIITGGNTTGIVLFLRIIGSAIHLSIGVWFFLVARKRFCFNTSILIALVHVNFLPKWIVLPEFEIMHYWSVCVLFLALLTWYESGRQKRYLFISGIALWVLVSTYPTMILLYPFYAYTLWKLDGRGYKQRALTILWFTLPALVIGLGLVLYMLSYMSVPEMIQNISYIMMDESHSESLSVRVMKYVDELKTFFSKFILYLPFSLVLAFLSGKINTLKGIMIFPVRVLLITIGLYQINHIAYLFLGDGNQFFLYFRFLIVTVLGVLGTFLYKENRNYFLLGIVPGIISVIASAAVTNMTFEIALARIYIAVIATCFIISTLIKDKYNDNTILKGITFGTTVLFVAGLLVCKLLLVRVTGCIPISIKMHMDLVTKGPAAGLLVKEELAEQYNENIPIIQEYVDENDNLLYFGCENIYYMTVDSEIATPTTQGTAVFNEMFLEYYEEHPDKLPNVVIIDKTYFTNPDYNYSFYSSQNQIVLNWIKKEFKNATLQETDYLTIIKKETSSG